MRRFSIDGVNSEKLSRPIEATIWAALATASTEEARQALIARHGAALVKSFNSYATLMRKLGLEGPYA